MPFSSRDSNSQVHFHGPMAGLAAGTAGVVICGLMVLGVWHKVSGQVGEAVTVIVWAVAAAVLAAVLFGVTYGLLRLLPHVPRQLQSGRRAVRAEVVQPTAPEIPAASAQELPVADVPAIEAPRPEIHYHFDSAEAVEAALAAMTEGRDLPE